MSQMGHLPHKISYRAKSGRPHLRNCVDSGGKVVSLVGATKHKERKANVPAHLRTYCTIAIRFTRQLPLKEEDSSAPLNAPAPLTENW